MKRCPTCGRTYDDAPTFCPDEGTRLEAVVAPVKIRTAPAVPPFAATAAEADDDELLAALVDERRRGLAGPRMRSAAPGRAAAPFGPPPSARPEPARAASTEVKQCPRCGRFYDAGSAFCLNDGTPLVASGTVAAPAEPLPPAVPPSAVSPVTAPTTPRPSEHPREDKRRSRAGRWIGVAALLIAGGAAMMYLLDRPPALESDAPEANAPGDSVRQDDTLEDEVLAALSAGNVVTPVGTSAYDLYKRLAAARPGGATVARVGAQALPVLIREIDAVYSRLYETAGAGRSAWDETARRTEWAVAIAPEDQRMQARHQYALGRLAYARQGYDETRRHYEAATRAWPGWALPYNSIGALYTGPQGRNYTEAARWYRAAIERDPRWVYPHQNLGAAYVELRQYGDAERVLRQALALNDALPRSHYLIGLAYAQQNRYAEAVRAGERALQLDPRNRSTGYEGDLAGLVAGWRAKARPSNNEAAPAPAPAPPAAPPVETYPRTPQAEPRTEPSDAPPSSRLAEAWAQYQQARAAAVSAQAQGDAAAKAQTCEALRAAGDDVLRLPDSGRYVSSINEDRRQSGC